MSFESDLTALVMPLFNGRMWWDSTPDGFSDRADPFVIVQQVGGRDEWYVDGSLPEHSNHRIQFFIWGERRNEVADAARALRKLIADATQVGMFITEPFGAAVADYNEVLKLRGSRQDFGFWYRDPAV